MKTNTFKKIFSLSFLLILAFGIIIPLQSLAAEPTVNLSVVSETQDGGTGNWNWIINVKTTNMPDGTTGFIDLYEKGKLINEQKDIVLKNNSVTYYTPKSFLNSGTTYSIVANFWINEKYVGNKFFSRTTPKSDVSAAIVESGDRATAIGAAITPPPTAQQNPTTVIGQTSKSTDTNYVLLAPIGKELTSFESDPKKNPCAFGNYLNIIIKIFFGICAVLAMLMIIMGGIQYMTSELISSKEAGKESITHAIFGFLLAVSAYLILNTLNPDLLNACLDKLPEASITIESENSPWDTYNKNGGNPKLCSEGFMDVKVVNTQPPAINVCRSISGNLMNMINAAAKDKIILSGSGSRTYEQQVWWRGQNGCADVYKTPPAQCKTETALPGTSKHESGKAVDFRCNGIHMGKTDKNNPCYKWLVANASKFSFYNKTSETWHWSNDGR